MIDDRRHMARALRLARHGLHSTDPNPRVGCVIVRDGEVVGEGWHERAGEPHAEVHALAMAGERARGATAYVTLEPCSHYGRTPPCASALVGAGVGRVVAAMEDPNPQVSGRGLSMLRDAGVETACGVLEDEARALNPGFISRMARGRPWVRVKSAISLDGRTAMATGESKWISSDASRRDVQLWRARSSAILTGMGTVLADDPSLNVRLDASELGVRAVRDPVRVVVDGAGRMPATARMLTLAGATWVAAPAGRNPPPGAEHLVVPLEGSHVNLEALMGVLADRGINEVLVEAGPGLGGALLALGLIDEMIVYLAPHLMGDGARGLFSLPDLERMEQRIALEIVDIRRVGPDLRMIARPATPGGR
ncbi:MAG: bifunctional diaminohydroxyphosphoribosylaminopyrimidine deaminase/5-amino-6-(5-phosphoribosylamino)uracil reductase RibD [Gammaproteobacteria bacterium]